MVIAIDGPAGSGKSTIARLLASELGYYFLNTGSFYRAYTLAQIERGLDPLDADSVLETAKSIKLSVSNGDIHIDGVDVENKLHTPEVDKFCSPVSVDPRLREYVNEQVRTLAKGMDIVTEGRDTTTVIFPDADYKFYFDASAEVRAERRTEPRSVLNPYCFPNSFSPMRKTGTVRANIAVPRSHPKRWYSIVAIPDTPPGASFAGLRNTATAKAVTADPMIIYR